MTRGNITDLESLRRNFLDSDGAARILLWYWIWC
jgi:hypothetical protein